MFKQVPLFVVSQIHAMTMTTCWLMFAVALATVPRITIYDPTHLQILSNVCASAFHIEQYMPRSNEKCRAIVNTNNDPNNVNSQMKSIQIIKFDDNPSKFYAYIFDNRRLRCRTLLYYGRTIAIYFSWCVWTRAYMCVSFASRLTQFNSNSSRME